MKNIQVQLKLAISRLNMNELSIGYSAYENKKCRINFFHLKISLRKLNLKIRWLLDYMFMYL